MSSAAGSATSLPVVVAQRGQVADLPQGDEALVGRVLPCRGPEEVDLLVGRGQPGEVEVAQPLQLHPLGDARVQTAQQPFLREAVGGRPEGEVVVHARRVARDGRW